MAGRADPRALDAVSDPLGPLLRRAGSPDPADRPADAAALVTAVADAFGEPPPTAGGESTANPYKGLRAFEEGDADDFFGRE